LGPMESAITTRPPRMTSTTSGNICSMCCVLQIATLRVGWKVREVRMWARDHRAGLVRVPLLRCGWATPPSLLPFLQVAVLINAAQVKLEGCPPAVDFYLVDVLSKKVYNLNRSAPFLKYTPGLC
jgi:hypothetical protein